LELFVYLRDEVGSAGEGGKKDCEACSEVNHLSDVLVWRKDDRGGRDLRRVFGEEKGLREFFLFKVTKRH